MANSHKIICWYCKKEFEYQGDKYQDVFCFFCDIMISVYDPADYIPIPPEQEEEWILSSSLK